MYRHGTKNRMQQQWQQTEGIHLCNFPQFRTELEMYFRRVQMIEICFSIIERVYRSIQYVLHINRQLLLREEDNNHLFYELVFAVAVILLVFITITLNAI